MCWLNKFRLQFYLSKSNQIIEFQRLYSASPGYFIESGKYGVLYFEVYSATSFKAKKAPATNFLSTHLLYTIQQM